MSRKNKANIQPAERRPVRPRLIFGRVPGSVPIAKPASNIQLTPIVQPVALVPYSTQAQPLIVMEQEYYE